MSVLPSRSRSCSRRSSSGTLSVTTVFLVLAMVAVASCDDSPENQPANDVGTGTGTGTGSADGGVPIGATTLTVSAPQNMMALDACDVTPAELRVLPAGSYTITLTSSTLSKGNVATSPPAASKDNYVIVHLPLAPGDPGEEHRFFMLNGIGSSFAFTLPREGTIQVMFVDSDVAGNNGDATVTVTPGNNQVAVDAVANVLRWQQGCNSTPAMVDISAGHHTVVLDSSSLSSGSGAKDDFVLLRLPSEVAQDDHRYVILNGPKASFPFDSVDGGTLRAWFISATATGVGGQAVISIR